MNPIANQNTNIKNSGLEARRSNLESDVNSTALSKVASSPTTAELLAKNSAHGNTDIAQETKDASIDIPELENPFLNESDPKPLPGGGINIGAELVDFIFSTLAERPVNSPAPQKPTDGGSEGPPTNPTDTSQPAPVEEPTTNPHPPVVEQPTPNPHPPVVEPPTTNPHPPEVVAPTPTKPGGSDTNGPPSGPSSSPSSPPKPEPVEPPTPNPHPPEVVAPTPNPHP